MSTRIAVIDVGLIVLARHCTAGTAEQRKQRRDTVQALLDQAGDAIAAAGLRLIGPGFRLDDDAQPLAPVDVTLDTQQLAVLAEMVARAEWPATVNGAAEERVIALPERFQDWLTAAIAEEQFNQLDPEIRARLLDQRAQERAS